MAHLDISFLGPFRVRLDERPVTGFGTVKAQALLAYLVMDPHRVFQRDTLAGVFWPDSPTDKARASLRQAIASLNRALGSASAWPPFLLQSRDTVQFNPEADYRLDVAEFAALREAIQSHLHRRPARCLVCMRRLEAMAQLYRGPLLQDLSVGDSSAFEEWATIQREHLQRQVIEVLAALQGYHEQSGRLDRAIQVARHQIQLEPWREESHRDLMRLLALAGQRSAALAHYRICRQSLVQELGVEPTVETTALYEEIKEGEMGALLRTAPYDLPPPSGPLIGRGEEQAQLAELLTQPHVTLVTLLGPGGIGKTRLALQVAADQVGLYRDGVAFVALDALGAAELLAPTIAEALRLPLQGGAPAEQQLIDFVRNKELLLVLDNLEHLLEGVGLIGRLLRAAPELTLLVTSRQRLHLRQERVFELGGLPLPAGPEDPDLEAYPSVALLLDGARRTRHDYQITPDERPHAVRICRLTQGMPLAIELAAAWMRVRSAAEIADDLALNQDLPRSTLRDMPERHRSMQAVFEASWKLLTPPEQESLSQLAIFPGSFTGEAAGEVTGAAPGLLAGLVDKSLVQRMPNGRYELHRLLRQYADAHLCANPVQHSAAAARHSRTYLRFLAHRQEALRGSGQARVLVELAAEIHHLRAAWHYAAAHQELTGLADGLHGLATFYSIRSWHQEGADLLGQTAAALRAHSAGAAGERQALLSAVLAWQGTFLQQLGRYDQAREALEESWALLGGGENAVGEAFALAARGQLACHAASDYPGAASLFHEALARYQALGDRYGQAQCLDGLGDAAARQGQWAEARAFYQGGLALRRQIGDRWGTSISLGSLGGLAGRLGEYDQARAYFDESLALSRELDNPRGVAACLHNLSTLAYLRGDYGTARRMRLETLAICRQIGYRWGVASALKSLGDVAARMERYIEAVRLLRESLEILGETGDRRGQAFVLNSLGAITLAQGDLATARQQLQAALEAAMEIGEPALALDVLSSVAELYRRRGMGEEAVALLTLVRDHPAAEQQTRDSASRLEASLAADLTPEAAAAASRRGAALSLEQVAAHILTGGQLTGP